MASNGFEGLELLDDGSELLIFYSEQHSTISITVHQELERSRIRKTYMPIKTGGKNALDFQLVSWLGYEIAKNGGEQFVIISKDTGFDAVVDFWQKRNVNVSRHPDLRKAVKKTILKRAPEAAAEIPEELPQPQAVNNALVKIYGTEMAGKIYKGIKPLLKGRKGE